MSPVRTPGRCLQVKVFQATHRPSLRHLLISHPSLHTTFRLPADTMSLFVSPRAQRALATVNAPSHLEKGHESQAQPDPSPPKLQAELRRFHLLQLGFGRVGPPLEDGPPPPGLRRGLLKKEKEDARRESRLKLSANAEPNPTTSYTPNIIQYLKAFLKSSVQRTYSSFRSREYDSGAPHLPDTSDSRGKVGPSSNSTPPLGRRETPTTHSSESLLTQNQPKHVIGVHSVNSIVPSTNPWPLAPRSSGQTTNPCNNL